MEMSRPGDWLVYHEVDAERRKPVDDGAHVIRTKRPGAQDLTIRKSHHPGARGKDYVIHRKGRIPIDEATVCHQPIERITRPPRGDGHADAMAALHAEGREIPHAKASIIGQQRAVKIRNKDPRTSAVSAQSHLPPSP